MEVIDKYMELAKKVEGLRKKKHEQRDGCLKERRAYGFYLGPLFRELVNLFDSDACWASAGVHRVPVGRLHYRALWDTMFEGIYRACDSGTTRDQIKAHASTKTLSGRWANRTSSEVAETMARCAHKNRPEQHLETFETLLLSFDTPGFSKPILNEDVLSVPFFSQLAKMVDSTVSYATPDEFSVELRRLREQFPLPSNMVFLKQKFYPSRGDFRAYVSDSCEVRQLTGSLLASIHKPAQDEQSVRDGVSRALFPRDKNLINQTLDVKGFLATGFSDVSSFTSGYTGTWMGLFALLLALRYQPSLKHLNSARTVMVEGYPFEYRVADVIQIYLYLTVGLEALDESSDELYTPTGGLLGVSGNSALSLYFYAVEMQWVVRSIRVRDSGLYLRCQIGGDDIFLVATHPSPGIALAAVYDVLQYLKTNVGFSREETLREVGAYELKSAGESLGVFCKKDVLAKRTMSGVKLQSFRGYPAPEGLLLPPCQEEERCETLETVRLLMEDLVTGGTLSLEEACSFLGASERRLSCKSSSVSPCLYVVGQNSLKGYCVGPDAAELLQREVSFLQSDGTVVCLSYHERLAFWGKRKRLASVTALTVWGERVTVVRTHRDPVVTTLGTKEGAVTARHDDLALDLYNTIKSYD